MLKHANAKKKKEKEKKSLNCQVKFRKWNMIVLDPTFTCIKTKSLGNVQIRMNKGSDLTVLVNILKHPHF